MQNSDDTTEKAGLTQKSGGEMFQWWKQRARREIVGGRKRV